MRGGRRLAILALVGAVVLTAAPRAARAHDAPERAGAAALPGSPRPSLAVIGPAPPFTLVAPRRPAPGAGRVGRVDEAPPRRRNRSPRAPLPDRRRGPDPGDLQPRPVRRAPGAPRHSRAARAPRSLTCLKTAPSRTGRSSSTASRRLGEPARLADRRARGARRSDLAGAGDGRAALRADRAPAG